MTYWKNADLHTVTASTCLRPEAAAALPLQGVIGSTISLPGPQGYGARRARTSEDPALQPPACLAVPATRPTFPSPCFRASHTATRGETMYSVPSDLCSARGERESLARACGRGPSIRPKTALAAKDVDV